MTVQALDHVNIRVAAADLPRLRDFYRDVLGLTVGWRPPFASHGYWLYAGDRPIVHLVQRTESELDRPYAEGTVDHFAFRCSDLEGVLGRLALSGTPFTRSQVPGTQITQILCLDPIGLRVELSFDDLRPG